MCSVVSDYPRWGLAMFARTATKRTVVDEPDNANIGNLNVLR